DAGVEAGGYLPRDLFGPAYLFNEVVHHLAGGTDGNVAVSVFGIVVRLLMMVDHHEVAGRIFQGSLHVAGPREAVEVEGKDQVGLLDKLVTFAGFPLVDEDLFGGRHPLQKGREIIGRDKVHVVLFFFQQQFQGQGRAHGVAVWAFMWYDHYFLRAAQQFLEFGYFLVCHRRRRYGYLRKNDSEGKAAEALPCPLPYFFSSYSVLRSKQ